MEDRTDATAVVSKDSAKHYAWGQGCDGWHLVASKNLSVIEERVPPGACEVRHYHQSAEQFFFVLAGVATIEVGDVVHHIEAQQGLHIPAKTVHRLKNDATVDLCFIVISTPPSHGDRICV